MRDSANDASSSSSGDYSRIVSRPVGNFTTRREIKNGLAAIRRNRYPPVSLLILRRPGIQPYLRTRKRAEIQLKVAKRPKHRFT